MISPQTSEYDLVCDCIKGSTEAFGVLVQRYHPYVSSMTYSAIGDSHKSEEVAQDVFVLAWKNLSQLRDIKKFKSWLAAITKNQIRKAYRRDKTDVINNSISASAAPTDIPSYIAPVDELICEETEKVVWSTLSALPQKYRQVLVMYYRSGKNLRQIAGFMGISEAAAKKRLVRAREMVRENIEGYMEETITKTTDPHKFSAGVLAAIGVAGVMATASTASAATATTATAATPATSGGVGILSCITNGIAAKVTATAVLLVVTATTTGLVMQDNDNEKDKAAQTDSEPIKILPLELDKGMVMYLSFDNVVKNDGKRTIVDESVCDNNGVLLGGKITKGKIGKALKCRADKKGDGVIIKDHDSLDLEAVTITAWIKTDRIDNQWFRILDKGWSESYNLCIGGSYQGQTWFRDRLTFECVKKSITSKKTVVDGKWHFVAGTYDGQIQRVYIDGKVDIQSGDDSKPVPMKSNKVDIRIGQLAVPEPKPYDEAFFDGMIDEIRLYNRVLTDEEIDILYRYMPE